MTFVYYVTNQLRKENIHMRTKSEVIDRLALLIQAVAGFKLRYSHLGQIDKGSGEGSKLQTQIDSYEGEIKGLKWVLGIGTF